MEKLITGPKIFIFIIGGMTHSEVLETCPQNAVYPKIEVYFKVIELGSQEFDDCR
jgi:hypothetical protein